VGHEARILIDEPELTPLAVGLKHPAAIHWGAAREAEAESSVAANLDLPPVRPNDDEGLGICARRRPQDGDE